MQKVKINAAAKTINILLHFQCYFHVIASYGKKGVICGMDNCLTFNEKSVITIDPNDNKDMKEVKTEITAMMEKLYLMKTSLKKSYES